MEGLQQQLLNKIVDQFPKKPAAVDALSSLLNVGKDAVYRRMRGETQLTPDEISLLSRTFRLSLDTLIFDDSKNIITSYSGLTNPVDSFERYLANVEGQLSHNASSKNIQLYYAVNNIPFFHYIYFPELISFKLYTWGLAVWGLEHLQEAKFHFGLIEQPILDRASNVLNYYNQLDSIELWSLEIMDNTLNQIEYLSSSGCFLHDQDALTLCDRLSDLAAHLQRMTKDGKKYLPNQQANNKSGQLIAYHNEMISSNNILLAVTDGHKQIVTAFGNPDYLTFNDQALCEYIEQWLKKLIKRSSILSIHSSRNRDWFISRLHRKIAAARRRIEANIEEI